MRKVSLISTVLNERQQLRHWIESLRLQSRQPDEIVICDGGSSDGTLEELNTLSKQPLQPPLRVISKPGVNIAAGRNAAIAAASGEIIVVSDAGCSPDREWLNGMLKPFETREGTQAVAGHYRFLDDTPFRKAAAAYLGRPWENTAFLPSSRSVAFTRKAWQQVGGYPEWLTQAAEDTLFNQALLSAGIAFVQAPDAIVVWEIRPTLSSFLKMIYRNAFGDAETGTGRSNFWKTILKLLVTVGVVAAIAAACSKFFDLWIALGCGLSIPSAAIVMRALKRRVPVVGWFYFFTLSILGGPAYLMGYIQGCLCGKKPGKGNRSQGG